MTNSRRSPMLLVLLIGVALLVGCSHRSRLMQQAPAGTSYRPESQQSLVIFVRLPTEYLQYHSSVFDLTPTEDKLVGILSDRTKVAYLTTPGEHTFMLVVMGHSSDFMKARLEAGKTYYVLLSPNKEIRRPPVTFAPVKGKDLHSEGVTKWVEGSAYLENTPASYDWAKTTASSIQSKKRAALPDWERQPEAGKSALAPEDGM